MQLSPKAMLLRDIYSIIRCRVCFLQPSRITTLGFALGPHTASRRGPPYHLCQAAQLWRAASLVRRPEGTRVARFRPTPIESVSLASLATRARHISPPIPLSVKQIVDRLFLLWLSETTTEGSTGRKSIPRPGPACKRAAAVIHCVAAQLVRCAVVAFPSRLTE
jgi:hypothetical protein